MKIKSMLAAAIIGVASSSVLDAAVGADQAARLGADLTPVGAEKGRQCRRFDPGLGRQGRDGARRLETGHRVPESLPG